MVDDEPAMMGEKKVGSGEVFNEMGQYRLFIDGAIRETP